MKTLKITTGLCALALAFTSCQNGQSENAKKEVKAYTSYVDSISNLELAEANANWANIENGYNNHKAIASENLIHVDEKEQFNKDIEASTAEFEAYKQKVVADKQEKDLAASKNNFRSTLLGERYVKDDMDFSWIDKDNILAVYQNFVDTVDANKDNYSREQWDEIKLLYEAIDTRKNTVEKEGLSSADNRKIAALKLKFAPMYSVNRIAAKSNENAEAKE
ncbi:hypothetical protein ACFFU9_11705 [Mariniflexile ostreae]|uniref:Lipoprotein n=1 Tax=Mariniflexile ostreae TaxID=1520892 RepID=A0ABV5FD80_9FLAO